MSTRPERRRILAEVRRIKTENPCVDCLLFWPYYVMQFDHLPEFPKVDKINRLVYTSSYLVVMTEIAKCELVCANCHHIRTYERQNVTQCDIIGEQDDAITL